MACGEESYAEFFLQEIPEKREFQKRVAIDAGVWGQSCGVRLAKRFYYKLLEGFETIDEIMGDSQLLADEGGVGAATSALARICRERDFHCDTEDVPALLFEEIGSGAAIDSAAHKDGDGSTSLTTSLLVGFLRGLPREMA